MKATRRQPHPCYRLMPEAKLRLPLMTAEFVRYHHTEPFDHVVLLEDVHWLDLCLTPRPANWRACYCEHWSPHRFERLGAVVLLPAGEAVHVRGDCGHQTSIVCRLHPEPIRTFFEDDLAWTAQQLEASLDISSASIRRLILRLGEELRHPGFASHMLAELIARQIVIELLRYRSALSVSPTTGGLSPWQLRIIDERVAEQRAVPTLGELAGLCRLSVRQLTRGFRASRGCSIRQDVARRQIDHAMRLLAAGEAVKSIAYSMGFASPSSFSYAFRRATGQTPRQFRQQALSGGGSVRLSPSESSSSNRRA